MNLPLPAVPVSMRLLLVGLLASASMLPPANAQQTPPEKPAAPPTTTVATPLTEKPVSPLVAAAQKGKAQAKKKKPTKRITNEDVKKSEGKLTIRPELAPLPEMPASTGPAVSEIQKLEEKRAEEARIRAAVAKAQREVESLEKEMTNLEEDYYTENDADYRDEVIQKRFQTAKKQLEEAREKLRQARGNQ